jgi:hypothetical protein
MKFSLRVLAILIGSILLGALSDRKYVGRAAVAGELNFRELPWAQSPTPPCGSRSRLFAPIVQSNIAGRGFRQPSLALFSLPV